MMDQFKMHLVKSGFAENTVLSYTETVRLFLGRYRRVSEENLAAYKAWLIDHCKPNTVNLRLDAINKYLEFLHKDTLKLKGVKEGRKATLENVISNADYLFLKKRLKSDGYLDWYFVVWFMGATGARISELLRLKAEHVHAGYVDLYSKGGKLRRIYFPAALQTEAEAWLRDKGVESGYLFLNRYGQVISPRGVAVRLAGFARRYGIDPKVVHPHSFRHLFAKNFLDRNNDIAFLADLLGHESIETTRIYLRKSSSEQREVLDRIVRW